MRKTEVALVALTFPTNRVNKSLKDEEEYLRLKDSIRVLGQSTRIMVTEDLEVLDGGLRVKAIKELAKEQPDYEGWKRIDAFIVNKNEEIAELNRLLEKGNEYEQDIARYRLSQITDEEYPDADFILRVEENLSRELQLQYRKGAITRRELKAFFERENEEVVEEEEEFEMEDWF